MNLYLFLGALVSLCGAAATLLVELRRRGHIKTEIVPLGPILLPDDETGLQSTLPHTRARGPLREALNATREARVVRDRALQVAKSAEADAFNAQVALEAEQHKADPYNRRRLPLPLAATSLLLIAGLNYVPAVAAVQLWWAPHSDVLLAVVIAVALAASAASTGHFYLDGKKRAAFATAALGAALVVTTSVLYYYRAQSTLSHLADEFAGAAYVQALLLGVVMAALTAASFGILVVSEPFALYGMRRERDRQEARAARAQAAVARAEEWHQRWVQELADFSPDAPEHWSELILAVESELRASRAPPTPQDA